MAGFKFSKVMLGQKSCRSHTTNYWSTWFCTDSTSTGLSNYIGSPPNCRAECITNSDCDWTKACSNQRCVAVCPGPCAQNAECKAIQHSAICACLKGFTGDPFTYCAPEQVRIERPPLQNPILQPSPPVPSDPCQPSPCGPNAECRSQNGIAVCSCIRGYFGQPPNCRPECTSNPDCPSDKACLQLRCVNPCTGACGFNAECRVQAHNPQCRCLSGYFGDPYRGCQLPPPEPPRIGPTPPPQPRNPCNPSPCGSNAKCTDRNGVGSCTCLPDFFGDPYTGCRPECVLNPDCPTTKACVRSHCTDPCSTNLCGYNADCSVRNHFASCSKFCIGFVSTYFSVDTNSVKCQTFPNPLFKLFQFVEKDLKEILSEAATRSVSDWIRCYVFSDFQTFQSTLHKMYRKMTFGWKIRKTLQCFVLFRAENFSNRRHIAIFQHGGDTARLKSISQITEPELYRISANLSDSDLAIRMILNQERYRRMTFPEFVIHRKYISLNSWFSCHVVFINIWFS